MKKYAVVVVGLFLLLYIAPLQIRPMMIPDESRYAEIPREMIASGDWIVPHINGLRYFEKPVMGYWITAASIFLFGQNAFAVRLPSALAAGISGLILFFMVRRFAGGYSAGLLAAAVFLSCLAVFGIGTFCVLDSLLALFITASMALYFFAYMEENPSRKFWMLALSGVCCGLAFLTKGFLAFAVPVIAIAPFMVWERRLRELLRHCWIPVAVAALVSLPWAVMIYHREPDFWHFFVYNEHIKRFLSHDAQHKAPFWYYVLMLPGVALPWTFLFPAVVSGLKQAGLKNPVVRFAVCWFVFPFLFFSASGGKLVTYILPCFPPLALLIAKGLHSYLTGRSQRAFTLGALSLAAVTVILAGGLVAVQLFGWNGFKPYAQTWRWALAVGGLLFWTVCLIFSVWVSEHQNKILLFAAAPLLFMFGTHFLLPDATIEHTAPGEFLMHHAPRFSPDTILVADEDPLRAVCWIYKRSNVYVIGSPGELSYGLNFADAKHRLLDPGQFKEMVVKDHQPGRIVLIAKAWKYKNWSTRLPKPLFKSSSGKGGFVFAQY